MANATANAGRTPHGRTGLTVTTATGDETVTAAAGTFSPGDVGASISGTGIPASTTIASVTDTDEVEMSAQATADGSPTDVAIGAVDPTAYGFVGVAVEEADEAAVHPAPPVGDGGATAITVLADSETEKPQFYIG